MSTYDLFRGAEQLFAERDHGHAALALEEILRRHEQEGTPVPGSVRELLARVYYHSARLGPAQEQARALLAQEPANEYGALLLSRTLQRSNRAAEAAGPLARYDALSGALD